MGRRNRPERSPHTANTTNYDIIMKLTAFHNYVIVLQYSRVLRRLGAGVASLRVQCIPGAFLIDVCSHVMSR